MEIQLERQQEPARLRVYIGAAPGVGKTYHMLNDALLKRQQGEDVIIGTSTPSSRAIPIPSSSMNWPIPTSPEAKTANGTRTCSSCSMRASM